MANQHDDMAGVAERKPDFEVSTRLLGSHIQFRDGSTARLGVNHIAKKLFREGRTGAILDLKEMLSRHCRQTGATPEALAAAAEARKQGSGTGKCAVNVTFAPGDFGFRANEGMKDVERIEFDMEFTRSIEEADLKWPTPSQSR